MNRLRDLVLIAVISLCLFEVTLQVAALGMWLRHRPEATLSNAGERSILCIGDSYTFGIGASGSEHSYPAALQRALRRDGQPWRVFNAGWPGRNSREALAVLDQELARTRPALVYILIGTNDTWTRPDLLDTGVRVEDGTRFRWRWRTARLAALIVSAGQEVIARRHTRIPDSSATAQTSKPEVQAAAPIRHPQPAQKHSPAKARAEILAASATTLARAGNRAGAIADLAKLHDELERSGSAEAIGQIFAATAVEVGEDDQALAVARRLAGRFPRNIDFARVVAWESFQGHDLATAVESIDRAVLLSETQPDPHRHAYLLRLRALMLFGTDRKKSMENGVASYLIDQNRGELRLLFQRDTQTFTQAFVERTLDGLQVPQNARADIRLILAEAHNPSNTVMATVSSHLQQMIARINAAGARAVLLSYPFPSSVNGVARQVADEMGAGWVDVVSEFTNRLKTQRREDLFVADGHLNDHGYSIVAELVSGDVKYRLMGSPAPRRPAPAWVFDVRGEQNAATFAAAADAPGTFKVDIQRVGTGNLWDVQLRQPKLALKEGTTYELAFRVRADVERHIAYGMNTHEFRNIGLFQEVIVGPAWQEFRQTFVAKSSDASSELHFDVGASTVSVELSDVVLRRLPGGGIVEPAS